MNRKPASLFLALVALVAVAHVPLKAMGDGGQSSEVCNDILIPASDEPYYQARSKCRDCCSKNSSRKRKLMLEIPWYGTETACRCRGPLNHDEKVHLDKCRRECQIKDQVGHLERDVELNSDPGYKSDAVGYVCNCYKKHYKEACGKNKMYKYGNSADAKRLCRTCCKKFAMEGTLMLLGGIRCSCKNDY